MFGVAWPVSRGIADDPGLIPRALGLLFDKLDTQWPCSTYVGWLGPKGFA